MKPPAPRTPQLPQNKDPAPTGNSQPPATPVKLIAQPRLKNADRFFRSEQPMAPRPEPATPESAASSVDDRSPPAVKTPAPHPRDAFTGSQKRPSDEEWLEESRKRSRQEQGPPQRGLHDSFFPEEDEEEYNTMFETPGAWQEGAGYAPQNGAHQDGGESDPEAYGFDNTGFDPRNHWQNTARGETNNPSSQSQAPVRADESSERSTRPPENFHQSQQDVQIPRNEQVTHEEDGQDRGADGAFAAMHQLNDDEAKTQIEDLKSRLTTRLNDLHSLLKRHDNFRAKILAELDAHKSTLGARGRALDDRTARVRSHFMGFNALGPQNSAASGSN